jgi:hypothetical protein
VSGLKDALFGLSVDQLPENGLLHREVVTLVVDEDEGPIRKLPIVYLNRTPVFGNRNADSVIVVMQRLVKALIDSAEVPHYLLTACRIGNRFGLFGADFYNRSKIRRDLTRKGVEFAGEQFTRFSTDGWFEASEWGRFEPSFIVLRTWADHTEDPTEVIETKGAELSFQVATYRLALMEPPELSALTSVLKGSPGVSAGDTDVLFAALSDLS